MLPLFLAAIAVNAADTRTTASQPAQATVTIVRGAEIRFGQPLRFEESTIRTALVRERDGSTQTASLIEFY